jgi:putative lipoic acid-binding regulatory protein
MNDEEARLETARLRALLESQHRFPGSYTFKIIYRNDDEMADRIREAVGGAMGIELPGELPIRASSGSKFQSMTLELEVQTAQDVLDVYEVLSELENIVSWF